jgi:predicted esterase
MTEPLLRSVETVTHGRVLLRPPKAQQIHEGAVPDIPLLVGFHGYGEGADRHLAQLERIPGSDVWLLASVQGLHRFYAGRMEEVVASWMTRQDREQAIADNIAYVDRAVEAIGAEHRFGRLVFAGFSQGVAMAFRAAARGMARPDAIIALGGDVPPDLRDLRPDRFPPALIGRGTRDTWYTEDKLNADLALLQSKGAQVRAVVFEGGHEWTDEFRAAAGEFLRSVATS